MHGHMKVKLKIRELLNVPLYVSYNKNYRFLSVS